MGFVISVVCGQQNHPPGQEVAVARLERTLESTSQPTWIAYRRATSRRAAETGVEVLSEIAGSNVVNLYEKLFEPDNSRPENNTSLKIDLECDHPFCGFRLQRHWSAITPILDTLRRADVHVIDLRALARRLSSD